MVIGAIVVNFVLTVRAIVSSTDTFFFLSSFSVFPVGVNSGTSEGVDPVVEADSVSLGGIFSTDSVEVSSTEELPTKRPLIFPSSKINNVKIFFKETLTRDTVVLNLTECDGIRYAHKTGL